MGNYSNTHLLSTQTMAATNENTFKVLEDIGKTKVGKFKKDGASDADQLQSSSIEVQIPSATGDGSGGGEVDSAWTPVQSNTKRRLAPQWTINRQDMGVDSPKNRASQQQEVVKKKGSRLFHFENTSFLIQ